MQRLHAEALASLPLFTGMTMEQIEHVARLGEVRLYPNGETLFAQGDPADRLHVLLSGRVNIRFKPHDGDLLSVAEISPGGVFGWSSALGRRAYTSSAISLEECQTFSLRGEALRKLCEIHPETGVTILERLAQVIADRLDSTHSQVVDLLRLSMKPRG
jgi:CRP/FNR family cyclic AMP-dependent transcriptional regulator